MKRTLGLFFALWFCLICKTNLVSLGCGDEERQALLSFNRSLYDADHILPDWKGGDCCRWAGVGCSNKTGHVIKLRIGSLIDCVDPYDCIYSSHLDHSLSALKHLQYLDLSLISFNYTSTIPQFIGSFSRLRYLNLSCNFGGTIPPNLGNLTNLQQLDLSYSDSLRAESLAWLSHLSSLRYLDMSGVNLTDAVDWSLVFNTLPALSILKLSQCGLQIFTVASAPKANLSSIATLDLSDNFLSHGTELDWLLNLSSSLVHLNLAGCNIYGPIPRVLGNLSSLKTLDLSENSLNGSVPGSLGQLSRLEILDLGENILQGPIQGTFGNLCNLQTLDLSNNQIVGDISGMGVALTRCLTYSLEKLDLSSNQLSGSLPDWIGQMRNLKYLILRGNSLNGSVPVSLGQLSELVCLDLSSNSLQGVVSDALFPNMTKLEELSLSFNRLDFNISSTWVPPFQLKLIGMGSCPVGPQFPSWLRTQREFSYIDISGARISGVVPDWFWNVSSGAVYINISHNQITGEVPASMKFLSTKSIDLSSNLFQGQLPYLNSSVEQLFLYDNLFSGNLEPILNEAMSNLYIVVLSRNHLTGNIPASICKLECMFSLDLSNNNLTGEFPKCPVQSYPPIIFMNLASNDLCGSIPQWIGYLRGLEMLQLRNNSFHGEIPSLRNCTEMIMLDLGENKLMGNIPTWIGENLSSLKFLCLRSNKFNGTIPAQLSYLTSLQVLDLAHNDLSGTIPCSFKNFTAMSQPNKTIENILFLPEIYILLYISSIHEASFFDTRFEETLVEVTKGRELDYTNTASLVMLLDLSSNSLSGEVPIELMNLVGLQSLNLSGNQLTGMIPDKIGGMVWLESLDLSTNQLSGSIPQSLTSLTALSHLNLSYNNLSGRIPSGNQLQTLIDPSIYNGNGNLCGFPLNACPGDGSSEVPIPVGSEDDDDESDMFGLYLSMGLGYVVGLWGVCGVFLFKRSWRIAYFQFIDDMANKISVAKGYLKRRMVCDSRPR